MDWTYTLTHALTVRNCHLIELISCFKNPQRNLHTSHKCVTCFRIVFNTRTSMPWYVDNRLLRHEQFVKFWRQMKITYCLEVIFFFFLLCSIAYYTSSRCLTRTAVSQIIVLMPIKRIVMLTCINSMKISNHQLFFHSII